MNINSYGGKNMPGRDGSGPMGQGALTGRGFGSCGTSRTARGFGRGFGMRRGFGRNYSEAPVEYTKDQEVADLKAEKEILERNLKSLNERMENLK